MKGLIQFAAVLLSVCALWSNEVAGSSLRNYQVSPGCPRPVVGICDAGKKAGCSVQLNDCPKGQICCFNGCGYTCVNRPVHPRCPPLKPGTVGICVEACSGHDDCPADELCCSNGCGHTCRPGLTLATPKCPPVKPGTVGICVEACSGSNDCSAGKLCCFNGCGHTCRPGI